jgi:hypothetical protein
MAVRALDRPVLVGNAAIVAGRPHALTTAPGWAASCGVVRSLT